LASTPSVFGHSRRTLEITYHGKARMQSAVSAHGYAAGNATLVTLIGDTGEILKFWPNTKEPLLEQAEAFLHQKQLIAVNTTCSICRRNLHACCFEVSQRGAIVNAFETLELGVPLTIRAKLSSERGLDPDLTKFMRSLGLSAPVYTQLGPHLHDMGVYKASQLTGVDPVKLVADLGLHDDGTLVRFLGNKLAERIAEEQSRHLQVDKQQAWAANTTSRGQHWQVEELIRRNGLFRGLRISKPGQDETNLQEAVQFTPKAVLTGESGLETAIMLTPDLKTSEFILESTSANDMNTASLLMDSYGETSLDSKSSSFSFSFGLDLGAVGIPVSANIGGGESKSSKKMEQLSEQDSTRETLNEKSHTYVKSKYFVEPRQMIIVDPQWLQPTPALKQAFHDVNESLHNRSKVYSVDHLFRDFGTHTCTRALLGGWWKITAKYSSKNMHKVLEMKQATSHAIDNVVTESSHHTVGIGFGSIAKFDSSHKDEATNEHHEKSERMHNQKEVVTNTDSNIDLMQEWKGGISGLQGETWRGSLDVAVNSNWKIIDRFLGSCRGIWRWVEDDELKSRICEGWRKGFIRSVEGLLQEAEHGDQEEWASCAGAAHMQQLQKKINGLRLEAAREEQRRAQQKCEATAGHYFEDGNCLVNRCKCGNRVGEVGKDCPSNGAEKCKEDQKAKCRTMTCPKNFWLKPDATSQEQRCASYKCREDPDQARCCQKVALTNTFTIELWTKDQGGCQACGRSKIKVKIKGTTRKATKWVNIGSGPKRGQMGTYHFSSSSQFKPTQICIKWRPKGLLCNWCPGNTLKVYNGKLRKSPMSYIGVASGWSKFKGRINGKEERCKQVVHTAQWL